VLENTEIKERIKLLTDKSKEQAYTEVTTHAVILPVAQVNLRPIKQKPTPLAYFSNGKRSADMKENASLVILQHVT